MNTIKLRIADKDLEFSFGLAFMGALLEETDLSIDEIVSKMSRNPFRMIPLIMFQSAKYALARKKLDIDFDIADMTDWIDISGGLANENVEKFMKEFTLSLTKDVPKDEELVASENGVSKKK